MRHGRVSQLPPHQLDGLIIIFCLPRTQDSLAEWSKAVDSSSIIFGCVGSNPTAVILRKGYTQCSKRALGRCATTLGKYLLAFKRSRR